MQPPNLTLSDVTKAAEDFIKNLHLSLSLPIPIEDIVNPSFRRSITKKTAKRRNG